MIVLMIASLGGAAWIQAASILQFTAATYTVAESAGAAVLSVRRTGDTDTEAGVSYATTYGSAAAVSKYTAVSGMLTFGRGETNRTIMVPILNNGFVEGAKNFSVALSNPEGGAALGTLTRATVFIADNDVGVQFQVAAYSVDEAAGTALIGVARGDDGMLPVPATMVRTPCPS